MRKRLLVALGLVAVAGTGAAAYWKLRPPPPTPAAAGDPKYEDIDRESYERWMQDLGYTE